MKLLKILLDTHKEEYELNLKEGLIKSTELGKTVGILKRNFPSNSFSYDKGTNTFNIKLSEVDQWDDIVKIANNLGWFPSWVSSTQYTGQYSSKLPLYINNKIRFEAKYDQKIEKIPSTLYHITPIENSDKIEKQGLAPKSRSKAAYHPDRVYLFTDLDSAEDLADMFYQKTGQDAWDTLQINITQIPGDYFQLYKDPNFIEGYYTLNNIPPNAIKRIKTIFT